MNSIIEHILRHDTQQQLASLVPVSPAELGDIKARYPSVSAQYLAFIEQIGVGTTTAELHIYAPEPLSDLAAHPSATLYATTSAQALFGTGAATAPIPDDAVMIADAGASWRYCLSPSLSDAVFVFDMANATFEVEAENFAQPACNTLIIKEET